MGTLFFFLTVLVVPGFPAGALVGRWALLAAAAAFLFFRCELSPWGWALLAYLGLAAWIAPVGYEASNLYCHAAMFVVVYAYASGMKDLRRVAIGLGLGFAVNSAVTVAQHFIDLSWIPQITPDGGLYFNRNIASEGAAMALAMVVGYRLWWLVPGILPTLAFGSRAPVLALGVVGAMAIWRKSKLLAVLAATVPTIIAVTWLQFHGVSGGKAPWLQDLWQRVGTWYDGARGFTILGQGLGSWIVNFPLYQHSSNALQLRWENAHNDVVQIIFELGVVGAVLVIAGLWRLLLSPRAPEYYCLCVFVLCGGVGFPLYEPVSGALAAACAGVLFSGLPPVRGHLARFGLRLWDGLANKRPGLFLPGRRAVPAQSRPPVRGGLYHHSSSRPDPDWAGY